MVLSFQRFYLIYVLIGPHMPLFRLSAWANFRFHLLSLTFSVSGGLCLWGGLEIVGVSACRRVTRPAASKL